MHLYYLNLLRAKAPPALRVKTVAPDLDTAIATARRYLGAISVLSSGFRDLGIGIECLGAGRYLPSQFDRCLSPQVIRVLMRDALPTAIR